jgi:hypothetical protein
MFVAREDSRWKMVKQIWRGEATKWKLFSSLKPPWYLPSIIWFIYTMGESTTLAQVMNKS